MFCKMTSLLSFVAPPRLVYLLITSPTGAVVKYRDEYVCVCVCLEDIFGTTCAISTKFLFMLPMAVARSSFGVVAIHYVLPVCG